MLRFLVALLILAPLAASAQPGGMPEWFDSSHVDQNGNPVFNSVPIADTTANGFTVVANYYTVGENIDEPTSSVFMAEQPSLDEYARFVTGTPSYFFIVAVGNEAKAMLSLFQDGESGPFRFFVLDLSGDGPEFVPTSYTFEPSNFAVMTEVRMVELLQRGVDPAANPVSSDDGTRVIFNQKLYNVVPFQRVFDDVVALVQERKLYE